MSNTSYPKGMEKLLSSSINFVTDTIKAGLVTTAYTFSASHEFLSNVGVRVGVDQELTGKQIADGVLDAGDLDFGALATGSELKAIVIYKDTGNAATSPLLFYLDVVTGLPMSTNGGGVTVPWDNGVKKIARLKLPFYPKGAEKTLGGTVSFQSDPLKVVLLPAAYVFSETHEYLSDIDAVIASAVVLTGCTVASGVFDADNADFGSPASGSIIGSALIYKDTGNFATSPLLLRITDVVGFPMSTNGSGVQLRWSDGAAKIISLVPA